MRLFENVKGYATEANAVRKLNKVLGERLEEFRYVITVNSEGRFVPVVVSTPKDVMKAQLPHLGIAVYG
jgi:hypothetical protein